MPLSCRRPRGLRCARPSSWQVWFAATAQRAFCQCARCSVLTCADSRHHSSVSLLLLLQVLIVRQGARAGEELHRPRHLGIRVRLVRRRRARLRRRCFVLDHPGRYRWIILGISRRRALAWSSGRHDPCCQPTLASSTAGPRSTSRCIGAALASSIGAALASSISMLVPCPVSSCLPPRPAPRLPSRSAPCSHLLG